MHLQDNQKITSQKLQSETISFLRFPLIIGVVLIHADFSEMVVNLLPNENFSIYRVVSYLFSDAFSSIAVPLFFFISGFLFFYKTPSFSLPVYAQKLKKRVKTILVPYIFWNLLVIGLFFLSQTLFSGLMSGENKLISDYTFSDWLWAFWDTNMINTSTNANTQAFPICYQFWFIRDLLVVMLCAPLVFFLLKKLRQGFPIILAILWLFNTTSHIVGISIGSFFFFSTGAWFSVYRKNFVEMMTPFLPAVMVLYPLFTFVDLMYKEQIWSMYLFRINILVGIVLAVTVSAYFLAKGKWRVNAFLSASSFFICAYHAMPLILLFKILLKTIQPHSDGMMLAIYVISPIIIVLIGLCLYSFLRTYFPKTTNLITGGR